MTDNLIDEWKNDDRYNVDTFTTLSEQSLVPIFIIKNDKIVYANPKSTELSGYTRDELLEYHFCHALAPEHVALSRNNYARHLEGGEVPPCEYTIIGKDGKKRDTIITTRLISHCGEPAVLCMVTDVSRQKEIQRALDQLKDEYTATIDLMDDYIHIVDNDLRVITINDALKKFNDMLRLPAEVRGRTITELYPFLPENTRSEYDEVFRTGKILVTQEQMTIDHVTVFTESRKIPLYENGSVNRIVTVVRDITRAKTTEQELVKVNEELNRSNKHLRNLIHTDPHTGLYNHRFFHEVLDEEFARAKEEGSQLSLVLLDLDYFKSINDVYGHQVGDQVLKQFAQMLKKIVRRSNSVIRYGGEEFIILSPQTNRVEAVKMAQRILDAVGITPFGGKSCNIKLKLSIAVVCYPKDGAVKPMDLLEQADQILNKAKEFGGNRVYCLEDVKKVKRPGGKESQANIRYLQEKMDRLNKRANQGLIEAIFAFAKTIELKDHYTGEHVERTVHFATQIAEAMGLSKEEVLHIKQAAVLHDLGKVGISEQILHKPAKLTAKEFKEIKKHPMIGVDIIRPIHLLHHIVPLIMYHHERWDGKGYPMGLKGKDIPIGARIIALADTYQALISNRPYRKAFPKTEAKTIIRRMSGSQFDPEVVEAFFKVM